MPHTTLMAGLDIPAGWSYNPSAWAQRVPIIALALVAFVSAAYMAIYQLGYVRTVWDPFFEDGTRRTLDSELSRAWPVSVAGVGAAAYALEALMAAMGDPRHWRTMPWMVALFGIVVVPLGVKLAT